MQNGGATRELKLATLDHLPKETMHGCDRPTLEDMGDTIRQKNLCGTRRLTVLAVGVKCEPTTPVSLSCTDTEPMPSSVESRAGPLVRGGHWGTKRRVDFAIGDDESDASGSESMRSKAYGAMQTRIKDAKNKKELNRAKAKATQPVKGPTNTTKRVKKSSAGGSQGSVEQKSDEKGRSLTILLARALEAVEHFEENNYPKKSDCTALEPLAKKLARVYEPCSMLVRQTELMEGLESTYSQNYDIRPR